MTVDDWLLQIYNSRSRVPSKSLLNPFWDWLQDNGGAGCSPEFLRGYSYVMSERKWPVGGPDTWYWFDEGYMDRVGKNPTRNRSDELPTGLFMALYHVLQPGNDASDGWLPIGRESYDNMSHDSPMSRIIGRIDQGRCRYVRKVVESLGKALARPDELRDSKSK
jgi:hypothetical protein